MTANRVNAITPSGIRRLMALAAEKENQGAPVIHMEVGQPHFDTPEHIKAAVVDALRRAIPGYTPNLGLPSLREAVAERVSKRNGISVDSSSVCITSGAVMALGLAIESLVDPDDEVLVPDPGWPNYTSAVTLAGAKVVPYRLAQERGFAIDIESLEEQLTPRTKMIIVNSPSNPTGAVFDEKVIRGLIDLATRHDLYVLSDEIYEDIVFEGPHHSILADGLGERLLMVSGVSKSYAMTGWRIGWLVAAQEVIQAAAKLIEPLTSCPATASQIAAEAALRGPQTCVGDMRDAYANSLRALTETLGPLGVLTNAPGGAFYVLLDISATGQTSDQFALDLLESKHVAVAPGLTFGGSADRYVRISTALSEETLAEGCRRIRDYVLDRLKVVEGER